LDVFISGAKTTYLSTQVVSGVRDAQSLICFFLHSVLTFTVCVFVLILFAIVL